MRSKQKLVLIVVLAWLFAVPVSAQTRVTVLDFELNDLTLKPRTAAEVKRTASLKPLLQQALSAQGHQIISLESEAQIEATKGAIGYLWDHPDLAAALGRRNGADFVVVGRVHKASFLFVYFMARVVDVKSRQPRGDLIVEVKGQQERLTGKGIARLAEQIDARLRQWAR